jgi:hypothetical protein
MLGHIGYAFYEVEDYKTAGDYLGQAFEPALHNNLDLHLNRPTLIATIKNVSKQW